MATCRFHLQPGRSRGREWSYSLNEHDDSLEKVTTVKRVVRVFRDLTPQLRDKRNCSLVHGPIITIIIFFFWSQYSIPREWKNYATQFKKVQKSSWSEPYSSNSIIITPTYYYYYYQVCLQLPTSAYNVTLLAIAAGRRPCSNRSISPVCRALSSKPTACCRSDRHTGQTVRWTDGHRIITQTQPNTVQAVSINLFILVYYYYLYIRLTAPLFQDNLGNPVPQR